MASATCAGLTRKARSRDAMDLPVVDLGVFLHAKSVDSEAVRDACRCVAETLALTGVLVVRDPRVSSADNSAFIDMMEEYFSQPHDKKARSRHT